MRRMGLALGLLLAVPAAATTLAIEGPVQPGSLRDVRVDVRAPAARGGG
jgi:hypothetical protein